MVFNFKLWCEVKRAATKTLPPVEMSQMNQVPNRHRHQVKKGLQNQGLRVAAAVLSTLALLHGAGAGQAFAESAEIQAIGRLEQQIEMLRLEVDRLKQGAARRDEAAAVAAAAPQASPIAPSLIVGSPGPGDGRIPTTARIRAGGAPSSTLGQTRIGGYGSVRYDATTAEDVNNTFAFRRFVLTADSQIADRLRIGFELEFERFRKLELERKATAEAGGLKVEQEIEGTDESEITVEQAWMEYAFADAFRLRMGGVLVPVGRFNVPHDDDRWTLPRRPLVDRGAPALAAKAAWSELGLGFLGEVQVGDEGLLDYQLFIVNGASLSPEVEEVIQTRDGRRDKLELEAKFKIQNGTFGNDVDDGKALTGRLAFSPSLGHEIAGSFYYGRYTPDWLPSEAVSTVAIDGITTWGSLALEGEYIYSDFGDVENIATSFAAIAIESSNATPSSASPDFESEIEFELDSLAKTRHGYWLEGRYDSRPRWLQDSFLGRSFADPRLVYAIRGEQVWIDGLMRDLKFTGGEVTSLTKSDHRVDRLSVGAAYRPVATVAIQLAYEYTRVDEGSLGLVTNHMATTDDEAHTVMLGGAFGF